VTGDANSGMELYALTNENPSAADDTVTVEGGRSSGINVLGNDSDPESGLLASSIAIKSSPAHGQMTVAASGLVNYTPASGFQGSDAVSYTVMDDLGGRSQTATVNITVTPAVVVEDKRGGGGTPGVWELLALLSIGALRVRRTRSLG
jgi:hypothetical protein